VTAFRPIALVVLTALQAAGVAGQAPVQPGPQDIDKAVEEYKNGKAAFDSKNWPEAQRRMLRAIALATKERPEEKETTRIVGIPITRTKPPYLPHYFLGRAMMAQSDCTGAVTAWADSERQGVIKSVQEKEKDKTYWAIVEEGYKECEGKGVLPPAKYDPLLKNVDQRTQDAARRLSELSARAGSGGRSASENPEVASRLASARTELDLVRKSLSEATHTRRQSDFDDASRRLDAVTKLLVTIEAGIRTVDKPVAETPPPKPPPTPEPVDPQVLAVARKGLLDEIDRGERALKALEASGPALSASMIERRNSARADLDSTRAVINADRPAPIAEATSRARAAATVLNDLLKERAAIANAESRLQLAAGSFGLLARRAEPLSAPIAEKRAKLQGQLESLKQRFARARQKGDMATLAQVERQSLVLKSDVETLAKEFGPLTLRDRGVSAALEEGAKLFLRGEYQPAVAALDTSLSTGQGPLDAHAHLFRAAARYALFVRSGEDDSKLLAQSLDDIDRCKQIDATLQPDPAVFAPRFVALFNEGRPSTPVPPPGAR
jgi:hypothetical protein